MRLENRQARYSLATKVSRHEYNAILMSTANTSMVRSNGLPGVKLRRAISMPIVALAQTPSSSVNMVKYK